MTVEFTHVFFDIGGVLGTNGWDRQQRKAALGHFGIDTEDFQYRHEETVGALEEGRIGLDEYLEITVFCCARGFSRDEFRTFMLMQSVADLDAIAIARGLSESGRYTMMTLNNESADLNRHRIVKFGLGNIFTAFLTSCWLRARKPTRIFYDLALAIANADPARSLFIDDREQNLAPASALGMTVIHFTSAAQLRTEFSRLGIESILHGG